MKRVKIINICNNRPSRQFCSIQTKSQLDAVQNIKNLQCDTNTSKTEIIENAFEIFNNSNDGEKTHLILDELIKLCLYLECPQNLLSIWNDIKNTKNISYTLLLKCCIKSNEFDTNTIIQILKWIKDRNYIFSKFELRDYSGSITILMSKYKNDIKMIKEIHSLIHPKSLNNVYIKTALIRSYSIASDIQTALNIFNSINDKQKDQRVISFMMDGFAMNGYHKQVLQTYDTFNSLHDEFSHLLALKACIALNNFEKGKEIINIEINDNEIIRNHKYNLALKNMMISFYGHFGDVQSALDIFNNLSKKEVIESSINNMMKCMLNNGWNEQILLLYGIHSVGLNSDGLHGYALKACINTGNIDYGKRICSNILSNHSNKNNLSPRLRNALIGFYGHIGDFENANTFCDINNIANIGIMMKMYLKNNMNKQLLSLYQQSQSVNDNISHIYALKSCININDFERGKQIHLKIAKNIQNIQLKSTLIEFYAHFGDIDTTLNIFDSIANNKKDTVCIAAMMNAFINNGLNEKAMELYNKYNLLNNDGTHVLALKCCIMNNDFDEGNNIQKQLMKNNKTNGHNIQLMNTLIDFHGHFGNIQKAKDIFDSIASNNKDIVSIGAMMQSYCFNNMYEECIKLFQSINNYRYLRVNSICYAIVFKACTQSALIELGQEIHNTLKQENEIILNDKEVQINLINMYAKSGMLNHCKNIFDNILNKNYIGIWNAMLNAFGRNGDVKSAKNAFNEMKHITNIEADRNTFVILINACSHCGDIDEAMNIWMNDIIDDKMKYNSYVMTSLIDCFSRKGLLKKSMELLVDYEENRIIEHDPNDKAMWVAILSGCNKHNETELGKQIYDEMTKRYNEEEMSDSNLTAASILLSNMEHRQIENVPNKKKHDLN